MALIDILPKFINKPLDLEAAPSRLVPKTTTPITTVPTPALPRLSEPVAKKLVPKVTITQPNQKLQLPDVFKGLNPLAEAVSDSSIVNPKARMAVIAQMALEKGWKTPEDFNFGNITTGGVWKGPSVIRGDKDAYGRKINQRFRMYGSPKEFMDDYLSLLKHQYPEAYNELHSDDFDVDRFTTGLVGGKIKYAEAPDYKERVKEIYQNVESKLNQNK